MTRAMEVPGILLPVALTLGLGALCGKKRILDRRGIDALKTVAVQIGLPAVLLHTFATAEYSLATLAVPPLMFAVCVLAWGRCCGRCSSRPSFWPSWRACCWGPRASISR
ncbi:MAG: hypothetical protein IJU12_12595 [Clostridia bacterium]|nr:hypothetical protein [Clostridia bacterium]